jgi:N-hydroxyarylamine O-acetyltransferase
MTQQIDMDAYCQRIQWGGQVRHDLATLASIVHAHMAHMPFENLNVLLGWPVRLDLDSLQTKLVHASRGGYCFEHSTLLGAVLDQLGFDVERKLARVTLKVPVNAVPRTHMFLVVTVPEGRFVVDAGFGGLAPQHPLPLLHTPPAQHARLTHWMTHEPPYWRMCAWSKGEVVEAWATTLEAEGPADFEMGNHFVATHPESVFVNRILLRAITPTGRVTVMNRDATIWHGTEAESFELADRAALHELLVTHFGIDVPQVRTMRVPSIEEWAQ